MIFFIFHDDTAKEQRFSGNKDFIVENQKEVSLINIRDIYVAIKAADSIENIIIDTKKL